MALWGVVLAQVRASRGLHKVHAFCVLVRHSTYTHCSPSMASTPGQDNLQLRNEEEEEEEEESSQSEEGDDEPVGPPDPRDSERADAIDTYQAGNKRKQKETSSTGIKAPRPQTVRVRTHQHIPAQHT